MFYIIAVILFVLWLAGIVSQYTMGGFIHLLPAIAVLVVLMRVIGGQNSYKYFTGFRMKKLHEEFSMNKSIALVLLAGGIALLFFGINEMEALSSDVSRFFTGAATNKAVWLLVGGVVGSSIGLVGLLSALGKH